MKRFWMLAILAVSAAAPAWAQPMALYENFGVIDTSSPSPQINALAFANYGSFSVANSAFGLPEFPYTVFPFGPDQPATQIPYDFQNVLNYTNAGTMIGGGGFRFDTVTDDGRRLSANSIVNKSGATITAQSALLSTSSYLLLSATNIANQGRLSATADGLIQIQGHDVDLSRGGLEIQPFNPTPGGGFCIPGGGGFSTPSFYFPEVGILDVLWSLNTNNPYRVTALFSTNNDGTVFISSPRVRLPPPQVGTFQLTLPRAHPFVYTNKVSDSNYIIQAVFVQDRDTNITSRVRFAPSTDGGNSARTAAVAMTTTATNIVTGQTINYAAYLLDTLLSSSNYVLLTNIATGTPSRPSVLTVTRVTPCEYANGAPTNAVLTASTFWSPPIDLLVTNLVNTNPPPNFNITNILSIIETNISYATNAVTNFNASYVAAITETAGSAVSVGGLPPTNQPGRIEIFADNLNLSHARIRGETSVSIHTKNLLENSNSFINVPLLNYDLGSTNGRLLIKDLAPGDVRVFNGEVAAWSGIWTNILNITNTVITGFGDTNTPPNLVTNTTTTAIEIDYEILIVDDALSTVSPVTVNDFEMHSTNVVFADRIQVTGSLAVDSVSFTVNTGGALTISGQPNWDANNFPNLKYLTNLGTISIPQLGIFGSGSNPYSSIVNQGSLSAYGQLVWADQFENGGLFSANASLKLTANTAKLDGGRFSAADDILIAAGYVKMRNYNISCAALTLVVTNSLADNGGGASNVIQCRDGFNLLLKPAQGDLFGTTINDAVPAGGSVTHIWAGQDRGPTLAGFSNNVVIGKLVLNADADSLLSFTGAGASNALYVDFLELDGAMTNNLDAALAIDSNLVIYYADSNLSPDTFLTNKAGGRLKWVAAFTGPNSSIDVALHSGQTVSINRSLRYSKTIDSDGDGIVNFYDPTPLDVNDSVLLSPITLSVVLINQPPLTVSLSWLGFAGSVYQVESATNLASPQWLVRATYTNNAAGGLGRFQEIVAPGQSQRYYRVKLVQ
ncbi:MAG: hypothetical protein ACYDH9_17440 [Limisphaerales bacterium]